MAKNSPNLMKTINPRIQEAPWSTSKVNMKKATPRHILIKLPKPSGKEKKSKNQPENTGHIPHGGMRMTVSFSLEGHKIMELYLSQCCKPEGKEETSL